MVPQGPSSAAVPAPQAGSTSSVAAMVESIVGCKWALRLLELLAPEARRPSEMQRACPGLSAKIMNERLRKMQRYGIIERTVFGEKPPVQVEYALTPFGRRFLRIIEEIHRLQQAVEAGDQVPAPVRPTGSVP